MTTSEPSFVWIWLPGASEPVVCGRIDAVVGEVRFTYAKSYRNRSDAIALQPDDLPLRSGSQRPPIGLDAHGVIRDAAPDSWGMRVILRRLHGERATDPGELDLVTYLRESGSNRIGALDFQDSPTDYRPRDSHGTLAELVVAGQSIANGQPLSKELFDALAYGTAVGGARPKAVLVDTSGDAPRELIAKFSVSTDVYPWMEAEAVGMELARRCGVDVARTELTSAAGRDVLLVERFDRPGDRQRRSVLSSLTLLGLNELAVQHGSYVELTDVIKRCFDDPTGTMHELFRRIVVNVLVGNTDDHPRNHAAFWDGEHLALTPAYDICPQPRDTGESTQGMKFGVDGLNASNLEACISAAAVYRLDPASARAIVDECSAVVHDSYDEVCRTLGVSDATHSLLWSKAIANPSVFYPFDSGNRA
ncbi:MAG: type II toxin-antitoxin system HipA family toxin [Microthrixaceae bacterium]|nr:type II toxin-antitoxin system HipA family toxin [Microthrixaceae bacterium]